MVAIPDNLQYLLKWETKAFAFLALTLKDGTPHVSPVWFDWDGTHVILNTARGRLKDKVLKRHPRVAVTVPDPRDMNTYIQIRGLVDSETEQGAYDEICRLREKYHGDRNFPRRPGEVRVTYTVLPERVYGE